MTDPTAPVRRSNGPWYAVVGAVFVVICVLNVFLHGPWVVYAIAAMLAVVARAILGASGRPGGRQRNRQR